MIPFFGKKDSERKPSSHRSKMCKESHQRSMTNFPPIAEYSRLTSPKTQHRDFREDRTRREPPIAGALGCRPRSYSDQSQGDVWSLGRRSIGSSNGRSSRSMSSGDASTVSTERLWRRRKLSPRRVMNRPVTPFPPENIPNNPVAAEAEHEPHNLTPSPPPQTKSTNPHVTDKVRGRTRLSLSQKHQPKTEEPNRGKITSLNRVMRKAEDHCLERKPHPPSQKLKEVEATEASERRRRKSMPDIYGRAKGEARKADAASKKAEARDLGEIIDPVTRDRIVNWLSEVEHAKDISQEVLQEELSCIDEE